LFQLAENWRNHVNEHSMMNDSKFNQDIVECSMQVHAGQQFEDQSTWIAPQYGSHPPPTASTGDSSDSNTAQYAAGLAPMPTSNSNTAWVGSPFSSSGSTRSNAAPSPSSSPSVSSYAPTQHGQQSLSAPGAYGPKAEFPHGQVRSGTGYEGATSALGTAGYFPMVHRSETPGMDSRPQTASSYDSAANFAIHGRPSNDVDAARHSSAPVSLSSGGQTNSGYNAVPQVSSSLYYNTSGVTYSPPGQGSTTDTSYQRGSPSMEDYQASAAHAAGSGYAVSASTSDSGYGGASSAFAADGSSASRVGHWGTGTDYHSTPSTPDSMAVDPLQHEHHQQPVQGATLYPAANPNDQAMRYFHTSGTP